MMLHVGVPVNTILVVRGRRTYRECGDESKQFSRTEENLAPDAQCSDVIAIIIYHIIQIVKVYYTSSGNRGWGGGVENLTRNTRRFPLCIHDSPKTLDTKS